MVARTRSLLLCAIAVAAAQCPSSRTAAALGERRGSGEPVPVQAAAGALVEDDDEEDEYDDYEDDEDGEEDNEEGELLWNPVEVALANHRAWLAERAAVQTPPEA
jgi:TATA-binding protein-associated factor Taf7